LLLVILGLLGYLSAQVSLLLLVAGLLGTALACSSLGMLVAAFSRSLDNYATMMNLVIFPVFFLSARSTRCSSCRTYCAWWLH